MEFRDSGPILKRGFLIGMDKGKRPSTDGVCSKGGYRGLSNGPGREPFIGDEFIFNVVQHVLQELFKNELENSMGIFPSSYQEKAKKKKKGEAVRKIL